MRSFRPASWTHARSRWLERDPRTERWGNRQPSAWFHRYRFFRNSQSITSSALSESPSGCDRSSRSYLPSDHRPVGFRRGAAWQTTGVSGAVDGVWDLVVVGAGPAGSAAALRARQLRPGARVLLLDREDFPPRQGLRRRHRRPRPRRAGPARPVRPARRLPADAAPGGGLAGR
ncbi:NAD(P)-binding protein [Planomonospora algeriensis]